MLSKSDWELFDAIRPGMNAKDVANAWGKRFLKIAGVMQMKPKTPFAISDDASNRPLPIEDERGVDAAEKAPGESGESGVDACVSCGPPVSEDLFAPEPCWCGFRRNCTRLLPAVRSVGKYVGIVINTALRQSKSKRKQANGGGGDYWLEDLSVWALQFQRKTEGEVNQHFSYLLIAHMLHSPIRMIALPLERLPIALPHHLALKFSFVETGADAHHLNSKTMCDLISASAEEHFDWETDEMHLLSLKFEVCSWVSMLIEKDGEGQTDPFCSKCVFFELL